MIAADWTPKAVQQVMGHRSVAFTLDTYGHLFETDLDSLASRLDDLRIDTAGPVGGTPFQRRVGVPITLVEG
jgi:hypothetical protein